MRHTHAVMLFAASTVCTVAAVAAGQQSTAPGGFAELHRARLSEESGIELVMGLIAREGESTSGRHHHPGGEFGFVVSGAIVVTTRDGHVRTVETGDSFYQPPGEWHAVSTGSRGAKTVVFRVVENGQPMVVPVE